MQIKSSFHVPLPVEEAWKTLLDVPTIAPCMPGARLLGVEDDDTYLGEVAVRLGPVMLKFKGKAQIVERDAESRSAKVKAQGRDTKGRGSANAEVLFTLVEDTGGTRVDIVTDLSLSGSVAQYGRGAAIIDDLSQHLVGEFARNLEAELRKSDANGISDMPAADVHGDTTGQESSTVRREARADTGVPRSDQPAAALSGFKLVMVIIRGFFGRLFGRKKNAE
jgi:uncharacterized protein